MANFIIDFDGTKILAQDEIQARYIMDALISTRVVEYNYKHKDPQYIIKKEWSLNIIRVEPGQVIDLTVKKPFEPEIEAIGSIGGPIKYNDETPI